MNKKIGEIIHDEIIETEEVIVTKSRKILGSIPEEAKRLDIYKICSYFLVCAFIGWIWETIAVWIITGQHLNRGFLFVMEPLGHYLPFLQSMPWLASVPLVWGLPIIMIYGIGGATVCILFRRWKRHPLELFFIGAVGCTALELFSSYLCDWLVHRQYWDYTGHFLNFQGRICLSSTLAWGFLCVVGVKLFAPRIDRLYMRLQTQRDFRTIILLLMAYVIICAAVKFFLVPTIIPT